jgi:hypothetical protein
MEEAEAPGGRPSVALTLLLRLGAAGFVAIIVALCGFGGPAGILLAWLLVRMSEISGRSGWPARCGGNALFSFMRRRLRPLINNSAMLVPHGLHGPRIEGFGERDRHGAIAPASRGLGGRRVGRG